MAPGRKLRCQISWQIYDLQFPKHEPIRKSAGAPSHVHIALVARDRDRVGGVLFDGVAGSRAAAVPCPAAVHPDHAVVLREQREQRAARGKSAPAAA